MTPYREMALNNAWANATLYAAMSPLSQADFTAPRPGFFPSLAATMDHIYAVDLYYIDALEQGGLGRSVYDRTPVTSVAELGGLQSQADLRLARFCSACAVSAAWILARRASSAFRISDDAYDTPRRARAASKAAGFSRIARMSGIGLFP